MFQVSLEENPVPSVAKGLLALRRAIYSAAGDAERDIA
jgi:hypothetical protein